MMFRLDGRVALVTGAGLGAGAGKAGGARIGFGIANSLAAQGAKVVVNDIDDERVDNAVREIELAGGSAIGAAFDVVDSHAVDLAFAHIAERLGPVDILVNNAGLFGAHPMSLKPFIDTNPEDWRPPVDANLYGAMNTTRAALPAMVERGWGRIIYISSEAGRTGAVVGVPISTYGAAKAGAAHFFRHLSGEVGRNGVTCNIISTGLIAGSASPEVEKVELARMPNTRLGTRNDMGAAAVFFASNEAEWINGQTLPVNGGSVSS